MRLRRTRLVVSRILLRMVTLANPLMKFMLSTRLQVLVSRRLLLLAFTGRRTGRRLTTPVSYVRDGSAVLVPAAGGWWKNLANGRRVQVRLRGSWRDAVPEVIRDPTDLANVLASMLIANPAISLFTGVALGRDGRPDPVALKREVQRGFVLVRLQLDVETAPVMTDPAIGSSSRSEAHGALANVSKIGRVT